jgi:integration host factor subunit alpha
MVEAFFDIVHATLVAGEDVKLSGFGNFNIRRKAPRPGRNPRTGEAVPVNEKAVPFFKAGKELRERVNRGKPARGVAPERMSA